MCGGRSEDLLLPSQQPPPPLLLLLLLLLQPPPPLPFLLRRRRRRKLSRVVKVPGEVRTLRVCPGRLAAIVLRLPPDLSANDSAAVSLRAACPPSPSLSLSNSVTLRSLCPSLYLIGSVMGLNEGGDEEGNRGGRARQWDRAVLPVG